MQSSLTFMHRTCHAQTRSAACLGCVQAYVTGGTRSRAKCQVARAGRSAGVALRVGHQGTTVLLLNWTCLQGARCRRCSTTSCGGAPGSQRARARAATGLLASPCWSRRQPAQRHTLWLLERRGAPAGRRTSYQSIIEAAYHSAASLNVRKHLTP